MNEFKITWFDGHDGACKTVMANDILDAINTCGIFASAILKIERVLPEEQQLITKDE